MSNCEETELLMDNYMWKGKRIPKCSHHSSSNVAFIGTQKLSQSKVGDLAIEFIINQYIA